MASKRNQRKRTPKTDELKDFRDHLKSCSNKKRFPSRDKALLSISGYDNQYSLTAYECQVCKGWHLTTIVA